MQGEWLSAEEASRWAGRLWELLSVVWVVLWFSRKPVKKREEWSERVPHLAMVVVGFWLLFGSTGVLGWLDHRVLSAEGPLPEAGLALTALGVGMAIWARLSLGSNWSGTVTLKNDHELIRKGLYQWVRHPIYSGILLGMIGTAMMKGHWRGWMGVAIVFVGFYSKARREERFLREEFGAGFDQHSPETGMFLPKWS